MSGSMRNSVNFLCTQASLLKISNKFDEVDIIFLGNPLISDLSEPPLCPCVSIVFPRDCFSFHRPFVLNFAFAYVFLMVLQSFGTLTHLTLPFKNESYGGYQLPPR